MIFALKLRISRDIFVSYGTATIRKSSLPNNFSCLFIFETTMKPQIFVGNLINSGLLSGKTTFPEVLIDFQCRYGDKFMFWFGPHPCVVFCRPEHAETILTDRQHFEQSPLAMPNFDLLCPYGLSPIRGAKWKRHVRVMLPMFKRANMIAHLDTILRCADRFIDQNLHDGQVHRNLYSCCQTFTMYVIGFIGFDYAFDDDALGTPMVG